MSFKDAQYAYDNMCEPEWGDDDEESVEDCEEDFEAANDEDINAECVWDIKG